MSKGHRRFRQWFAASGLSQADFARLAGCHQTAVSRVLAGQHRPGLELVAAVERLTAELPEGPITVVDWTVPDETDEAEQAGAHE